MIGKMVLFTAGAVGAALLAFRAAPSLSKASVAPRPAIAAAGLGVAGSERRWALTLEAKINNADNAGSALSTTLTGDWVVGVSRADGSSFDVACALEHAKLRGSGFGEASPSDLAAAEQRLQQRFWVTYQADGAAERVHFAPDASDDARRYLKLIVAQSELTRPQQPSPQWNARESDASGIYFAAYQALAGGEVIKHKLKYLSLEAQNDANSVQIDAAETRFTLDAEGHLKHLEGGESVRIAALANGPSWQIEVKLRLEAQGSDFAPALVGSLERAGASVLNEPLLANANDPDVQKRHDLQLIRGVSREALLAELASGHAGEDVPAKLEALLRQREQEAAQVAAWVRRADPKVAASALAALAGAGTDATQQALSALARDPDASLELRSDALTQFVQLKSPSAVSVNTLLELAGGTDAKLRQQALFVAGALGRTSRQTRPEASERLEGELLAREGRCSGSDCVDLLGALGNLATPKAFAAIQSSLRNSNASVRAAAVSALRLVDDADADRAIANSMTHDTDAAVREAAVFAAHFRRVEPLIDPLLHAAESDADASVRSRAIGVLADHLKSSDRIEPVLRRIAEKDSKPGVRRLAREVLEPQNTTKQR